MSNLNTLKFELELLFVVQTINSSNIYGTQKAQVSEINILKDKHVPKLELIETLIETLETFRNIWRHYVETLETLGHSVETLETLS